MLTVAELLDKILTDVKRSGDIVECAVVSRDGLLIASDISEDVDGRTLAAMTATMVSTAETSTSEIASGIPDKVIVETPTGKIVVTGAGSNALLVCTTQANVELGLVLLEVEQATEKIKQILTQEEM